MAHQTFVVALDLNADRVPFDRDVLVVLESLGHDIAGAKGLPTDEDGDVAGVFGEEHGLLGGRVTTTNDNQGLLPEDGGSTITHGACRHTVVPVFVLTGEVQTAGSCAGSENDGVGGVLSIRVPLGRELEGPLGEVQLGDGLADDLGAEALGLLPHGVHELTTHYTFGESGEVLDIGGGGQLSAGGYSVGHEAFVEGGLEVGPGQVDGGSVGSGPRADNYREREVACQRNLPKNGERVSRDRKTYQELGCECSSWARICYVDRKRSATVS